MSTSTGRLRRINPEGLHATPGYHHVTIIDSGPQAHLAGQCPLNARGELVGEGDLTSQVEQVVRNALVALEAVGAGPADVVRSLIYVASADRGDLVTAWEVLTSSELGAAFSTASTLLGVAQLGYPGQLIELDLTAALPDGAAAQP